MNNEPQSPRTVRFGVFEVDHAAAELRKRGRRTKLEALLKGEQPPAQIAQLARYSFSAGIASPRLIEPPPSLM